MPLSFEMLPDDIFCTVLLYMDPAVQSRLETAMPRASLRASFKAKWRYWLDYYDLPLPTRRTRLYKTYKKAFVRHAGRFCIGTTRDSGCWKFTTNEMTYVAQGFNEPRLCKRCEFVRFVSRSRAKSEFRAERKQMTIHNRSALRVHSNTLIASVDWRQVFYGKISRGVFARRSDLNMTRNHIAKYCAKRFDRS